MIIKLLRFVRCNNFISFIFLVSELPKFLIEMLKKGDLDKIKQIFAYVNQENINVEEMGVQNNEVNQGKKLSLVETNTGPLGRTTLILAASRGHHQICKYLITKLNADLEARDEYQMTALMYAAFSNRLEVIKVLLQYKANCKAKDEIGRHAAYVASYYGYLDALKMLVEKDGDVIDLKGYRGRTPLIAASIARQIDLCKYLVEERKANVNTEDDDGKNALQHAKNPKIIKILKNSAKKSKKIKRNKIFWMV